MGDVDDADALVGEPANDAEEGLDLALVEDRGGLVHDQQTHVVREGARDRDDLLRRRAQSLNPCPWRDRAVAESLEQRLGVAAHALEVEQRPAPGLVGEEDRLRDGQVLDQVELLVDRRHPAAQGTRRVAGGKRLAGEQDLARVGSTAPETHLIRVDLPAPLGPSRQWTSRSLTSKSTPDRALTPGNSLVKPADLEDLLRVRLRRHHPTTSGRRLLWAITSPCSTFSGVPPQTGSSCSTESTPSKPPS